MLLYLIVLFFCLIFGELFSPKTIRRKKLYLLISFGLIILVSSLRKFTVGLDLEDHYFKNYVRIASNSTLSFSMYPYEYGYTLFNYLLSRIFKNGQWLIAFHSLFVFGVSGWFVYKHSKDVVLSTVLVITLSYWFMFLTMLRQSMSVCFCLIGFHQLFSKKKIAALIRYYLLIVVAVFFHKSAILLAIFPLLYYFPVNKKRLIVFTLFALGTIPFINVIFYAIAQTNERYSLLYANAYSGFNNIILYWIVVTFLFVFVCLLNKKEFEKWESGAFWISFLLLYFRVSMISTNVLGRESYYFILPAIILFSNHCRIPLLRPRVSKTIYYLFFVSTFIVIGAFFASSLYGTVPLTFFWE